MAIIGILTLMKVLLTYIGLTTIAYKQKSCVGLIYSVCWLICASRCLWAEL